MSNKFGMDQVVVTAAASAHMANRGIDPHKLLYQHKANNWTGSETGKVKDDDFALSSTLTTHATPGGELWVITTFDPQSTVIKLPHEIG